MHRSETREQLEGEVDVGGSTSISASVQSPSQPESQSPSQALTLSAAGFRRTLLLFLLLVISSVL